MLGLAAKVLTLVGTILTLIPTVYLGYFAYRAEPWKTSVPAQDGARQLQEMIHQLYQQVATRFRRWHFIVAALGLALIVAGSAIDIAVAWGTLS